MLLATVVVAACAVDAPDVERAALESSVPASTKPGEPAPERGDATGRSASAATTPAAAAAAPAPDAQAAEAGGSSAPGPESGERRWTTAPYHGFGAWLDAFDWSPSFVRDPSHLVGPDAIDHMAAEGVQTLYIQANRWNSDTDRLDPTHLDPLIARARHHGIHVVAWYLPTFTDPDADLRRILALADLDIDGLAIDIEARDVADVAERNRRLVALSRSIRDALPGQVIGGIVLEPVLLEDVNDRYWPDFPWAGIAEHYDVWLPMGYWTNRRGEWRSAYRYTAENVRRIRAHIGDPDAVVHTIGGIGDRTTVSDLEEMVAAAVEVGAIGGSLYDYRTSRPEFWATLRSFVA